MWVSLPFWWFASTAIWIMKVLMGSFVRYNSNIQYQNQDCILYRRAGINVHNHFVPKTQTSKGNLDFFFLDSISPDSAARYESSHWAPPSLTAAEKKRSRIRNRMRSITRVPISALVTMTLPQSLYPDLLQVMEVVAHSDWNLAGRVAFIRFVVCINTQHLHCGPPPKVNPNKC